MPRILCDDGLPIAVIEFLPNNAFGDLLMSVEGELCSRLSPDEGAADIIDVSDEDLQKLRLGETVDVVAATYQDDDEEHGE
jgi:hypothetical protein